MLTPQYLANCSNDIVELYAELEIEVLKDIARRIKATGVVSSSAQWQIKMMQESGGLYDAIITKVAKINNVAKSDIEKLFEESGTRSLDFDNEIFKEAGLGTISNANSQILSAGINKTLGNVVNMAKTTASAGQQQFISASTKAYMQVSSGAFDYNTAIANACKDVAKTGLQTIMYDSGAKISLEAGIRRNVMTGVNQTAAEITWHNCDLLNCDLVETTVTRNSRPEHALWQGKQFSRSGKSEKYPDFISSTGYGTGEGICGWNCGHNFHPFFEGDKPAYTQAELDKINNETVEYNGKTISKYDAEQQQRYNERNIRRWKKESAMLSEAGVDNSFAKKKVKEWNAKAQDFTDKTGIPRQKAREKVFTGGGKSDIINKQHPLNATTGKPPVELSNEDIGAIYKYMSAESYTLNYKLRNDVRLTVNEQLLKRDIDDAIEKLPAYKGVVYRSLSSESIDNIEIFNTLHQKGKPVLYNSYTSSSTDIYDDTMDIQMIIKSKHGKDMRAFNPSESEILFKCKTMFIVTKREGNVIYMEEI